MSRNTKKPLTYLLGIAVLGIWGLIVHRLFAVSADDGPVQGSGKDFVLRTVAIPLVMPDTFSLMLNYPDPFSGEKPKDTTSRPEPVRKPALPSVMPAPIIQNPLDHLKYLGYVADGTGKQRVAIVSFQGREKMLKEGDTLGKIKILKIKKEALMVGYGKKTRLLKTE